MRAHGRAGILVLALLALLPQLAAADSALLTYTPVVIDEKAQSRDILKETISLTNTSNRKLTLYPSVNNVERTDGEQAFAPAQNAQDLSASLANWIELSRGVLEIAPGETRQVPFMIHINPNAVANTYHAQISFFDGSTREEAEAHPPLGVVTVNLEVQADVKEILQLNRFSTGRFFLAGDDVRFDYNLENIGNQELQPHGEIRVYDNKGREIASVDVNKEGKSVSPDKLAQLASVWSSAEGFGHYKALLTVYYGKDQTATVQDTVFFWIVPWKQLLILFALGLTGVVFFAFYFHRWLESKHALVPALAGVPAAMPPSLKAPAKNPLAVIAGAFTAVGKLKRGERTLPERTAAASASAVAPTPVAMERVPMQQPAQASSGTIDLKNFRQVAPQEAIEETHVIDLKRR
jgi:hypothetical protein